MGSVHKTSVKYTVLVLAIIALICSTLVLIHMLADIFPFTHNRAIVVQAHIEEYPQEYIEECAKEYAEKYQHETAYKVAAEPKYQTTYVSQNQLPPIGIVIPTQPQTTIFNIFPFYIPQNSYLYKDFHYHNPHLNAETVIWKVNAHLHLPFYSNIQINYNPTPLLVNTFYRLPYGFYPHELVPVNHANCFLRATPETVKAFRNLRAAAQQVNLDLSVTSAFRSPLRQADLFFAQVSSGAVARPYHSEHQTGRALDLWGPGGLLDARGSSPTGIWVAQNAHLHGFIIRYRAETTHITGFIHEPWHITYVGLELSMYMYENNILSLEEFVGRNPGRQ